MQVFFVTPADYRPTAICVFQRISTNMAKCVSPDVTQPLLFCFARLLGLVATAAVVCERTHNVMDPPGFPPCVCWTLAASMDWVLKLQLCKLSQSNHSAIWPEGNALLHNRYKTRLAFGQSHSFIFFYISFPCESTCPQDNQCDTQHPSVCRSHRQKVMRKCVCVVQPLASPQTTDARGWKWYRTSTRSGGNMLVPSARARSVQRVCRVRT